METPQAKAIYRLRKQTVELQYADMKQNRNFRGLSGRGLRRARIEVGLTELVYNLMIVERVLRNRREAKPATENTYVAASEQPDSLFSTGRTRQSSQYREARLRAFSLLWLEPVNRTVRTG